MSNTNDHSWLENALDNGGKACHPVAAALLGVTTSADGFLNMGLAVHSEIGFTTGVTTAIKASYKLEKYHLAMFTASVYCGSSYVAGGLDAWYQNNHNQRHIGTDFIDSAISCWGYSTNWYKSQEKGVEKFLIETYEWWRN